MEEKPVISVENSFIIVICLGEKVNHFTHIRFVFLGFLDPEKKLFSHRILSRDECIDPFSKTGNLRWENSSAQNDSQFIRL